MVRSFLASALILSAIIFTGFSSVSAATQVTVTEQIPWLNCSGTGKDPKTSRYVCTVPSGFQGVLLIMKGFIKYFTFIVALIGVLMIVVSGIQYSLSGASDSAAKEAKGRIKQVIAGLVLLFMIGLILNSVAPWIYR